SFVLHLPASPHTSMLSLHDALPISSAIMPRAVPRTPFVRFLSTEIKDAIDKAVQLLPVVLFMKGTPEFPQCGFLRATIQTLGQQDRKSTRLNSSHVSISYAVFCLKK